MNSIVESINYVYKELLNRDVDETSKYIYIDKIIKNEITIDDLKKIILNSDEYKSNIVTQIHFHFQKILNRNATNDEIEIIYKKRMNSNIINVIITIIKNTHDYKNIINDIYKDIFNRDIDDTQKKNIIIHPQIVHKNTIYTFIKNTAEYKDLIHTYFQEYHNKPATENDIHKIISKNIYTNIELKKYIQKNNKILSSLFLKLLNRRIREDEIDYCILHNIAKKDDIITYIKKTDEYKNLQSIIKNYILLLEKKEDTQQYLEENKNYIDYIKNNSIFLKYKTHIFVTLFSIDIHEIDILDDFDEIDYIEDDNKYIYVSTIYDKIIQKINSSVEEIYTIIADYYPKKDILYYKHIIYNKYNTVFNKICIDKNVVLKYIIFFLLEYISVDNFDDIFYNSDDFKLCFKNTFNSNIELRTQYTNKLDYNTLFTSITTHHKFVNKFQKKVNSMYNKYLHRDSTSLEYTDILQKYIHDNNYLDILKNNIFHSNEYIDVQSKKIYYILKTYINDIIKTNAFDKNCIYKLLVFIHNTEYSLKDNDIIKFIFTIDTLNKYFTNWYNRLHSIFLLLDIKIKSLDEYKACIIDENYTLEKIYKEIIDTHKQHIYDFFFKFIERIKCASSIIIHNEIEKICNKIYKYDTLDSIKRDILDISEVKTTIRKYIDSIYIEKYNRNIYDYEFYEIYTIHIDEYIANIELHIFESERYDMYCKNLLYKITKNRLSHNIEIDILIKTKIFNNNWKEDDIYKHILYSHYEYIENIIVYYIEKICNITITKTDISDIQDCIEYITKNVSCIDIDTFLYKIRDELEYYSDHLQYILKTSDILFYFKKCKFDMNIIDFILYDVGYEQELKSKIKNIYNIILINNDIHTINTINTSNTFLLDIIENIKKRELHFKDIYEYIKKSTFYKDTLKTYIKKIYKDIELENDENKIEIYINDLIHDIKTFTKIKKEILYSEVFIYKIFLKCNDTYLKLFKRKIEPDEIYVYLDLIYNDISFYKKIDIYINNILYYKNVIHLLYDYEYVVYDIINSDNNKFNEDILYNILLNKIYNRYLNRDIDISSKKTYKNNKSSIKDIIIDIKKSIEFKNNFNNYICEFLERRITPEELDYYIEIYIKSSKIFKESIIYDIDNTLLLKKLNNVHNEYFNRDIIDSDRFIKLCIDNDDFNTFDYEIINIDNKIKSIKNEIKSIYNIVLNRNPDKEGLYIYTYKIFYNEIKIKDLEYILVSSIKKNKNVNNMDIEECYKDIYINTHVCKLIVVNNILYLKRYHFICKIVSFDNLQIGEVEDNISNDQLYYVGDYITQQKQQSQVIQESQDIRISIIIINKDKPYMTIQCLNHILYYTKNIDYEIIVMDNNSTEKNYEILSLFCIQYKNIHIYRSTIDYGYSEINNIGVDNSHGKYILFLNNDTFMIDKWLDSIIDLIYTNSDILNDHYFGGKIMNIDNTVQELGCFINNIDYTTMKNTNKDDINKVDYVSACALFLSRDMFDKVNGFSSEYNMFYYEDIDLQMKLKKNGYRLSIIPEFTLYHINNMTTSHIKNIYDIKEYMKQKYIRDDRECDNQIDQYTNQYNDKILLIYDEKYKINKNLIQLLKSIEIYNSKSIHVDILTTYYISSYKIKYYCKLVDINIHSFSLIHNKDTIDKSEYIMIKDIIKETNVDILYNFNKQETEKQTEIETETEIEIFNIFSLLIQCVINSENIIIIYEIAKIISTAKNIHLNLLLNYDYDIVLIDYILKLNNMKNVYLFHEVDNKKLYDIYKKCTIIIKFPIYNKIYNSLYEINRVNKKYNILCISDTIEKIKIYNNNDELKTYRFNTICDNFIYFIKKYKDNLNKDTNLI